MNYQYRYGTTTTEAIRTLYADGGWARYYQGITAALVQGPVARFGDTAANVGILALLQSNPFMSKLPTLIKTLFASLAAAGFRMILTPIDTIKTTLQAQGREGIPILRKRVSLTVFVKEYRLIVVLRGVDQAVWHWYTMVWCNRNGCRDFCRTLSSSSYLQCQYLHFLTGLVTIVVWDLQLSRRHPSATTYNTGKTISARFHRLRCIRLFRFRVQLVTRLENI